jgi:hypothetical protein
MVAKNIILGASCVTVVVRAADGDLPTMPGYLTDAGCSSLTAPATCDDNQTAWNTYLTSVNICEIAKDITNFTGKLSEEKGTGSGKCAEAGKLCGAAPGKAVASTYCVADAKPSKPAKCSDDPTVKAAKSYVDKVAKDKTAIDKAHSGLSKKATDEAIAACVQKSGCSDTDCGKTSGAIKMAFSGLALAGLALLSSVL